MRSGGGYEERSFDCESIRGGVVSTCFDAQVGEEQKSEADI